MIADMSRLEAGAPEPGLPNRFDMGSERQSRLEAGAPELGPPNQLDMGSERQHPCWHMASATPWRTH